MVATRPGSGQERVRRAFDLRGIVQGVGFRPHVARQALRFQVAGFCGNNDEAVFVEAEGTEEEVEAFALALIEEAPPLALIDRVTTRELTPQGDTEFVIVPSQRAEGARTLIPADGGCCTDCERELLDPADRRFHYPFISCTNCGPRLSIIEDLPYDRPLTTLAPFPLCDACLAEYRDPEDRRFHAQPIGCFDCGPTLTLRHRAGWAVTDNRAAVSRAKQLLSEGEILAVKGLGGYTLMADATNEETVARLRERKRRPDKPFAVMTLDPSSLGDYSEEGLAEVTGSARPVVLAPRKDAANLAESVAPGLSTIGVMMPSMGLHYLLCEDMPPLIATSGNISGEPIFSDDAEAVAGLAQVADAFLSYDREICHPLEDSVMAQGPDGTVSVIRRGRGLSPLPLNLETGGACVVGVGGELKNAFTFTRDGRAFLSPHLGDMASLRCQGLLTGMLKHWEHLHRRQADLYVADLHPDYATTRWAQRQDAPLLQVQHHHAHALSLLAESGGGRVTGGEGEGDAVIAVLDGTGYSPDGTIWGCEFLGFGSDLLQPTRLAHLPAFPLPGGDHAIRHPWRVAAGLLHGWGIDACGLLPEGPEMEMTLGMLDAQVGTIPTTSMGRYFDAAAAILGLRHDISYDAQGPIEMQALAERFWSSQAARLPGDERWSDRWVLANDPVTLIEELVSRRVDGVELSQLAYQFHTSVAAWVANTLQSCAELSGVKRIGLSGGVADNTLLGFLVRNRLIAGGYDVLQHRSVPCGDGGLSLGQAYAGHLWLETGGEIRVLGNTGKDPSPVD